MDALEKEVRSAVIGVLRPWIEKHETPKNEEVTAIVLNHGLKQLYDSICSLKELYDLDNKDVNN